MYNRFSYRIFFLTPKSIDGKKPQPLKFVGGWLLTSPEEELSQQLEGLPHDIQSDPDSVSTNRASSIQVVQVSINHTH